MSNRNLLILAWALACMMLAGCRNTPQTTNEKIDALKQQVEADAKELNLIESNHYAKLNDDFKTCDSMLQYFSPKEVEMAFDKLNITQAYLQQFAETYPTMVKKMDYVLVQLDHLKQDAETQYISDSLALVYLGDESKVADTLHNQVLYFKDRFAQCQKDLDALKKTRK